MTESNKQTIAAYNGHIEQYIAGTPGEVSGDVKHWLAMTLDGIPRDAKILELGSGFGRDADYIESLGYSVKRTDASESFVKLLRERNNDATVFNAITDEFANNYDIIYANAVLLHFNDEETRLVSEKIYHALKAGGTFAFSLKRGDGDMWSNHKLGAPRYFNMWQQTDIERLLHQSGFKNIHFDIEQDQLESKWLFIIARKD